MTFFPDQKTRRSRARRRLRVFARALGVCAALAAAPAHSDTSPDAPPAKLFDALSARFSGATGGIFRLPENLQAKNRGNLFGEAWTKVVLELHRTDRAVTSVFSLGNFVFDTAGFTYNNTAKIGVGLSQSIQVSDALNVTLSARYDQFMERHTDLRRDGIRLAVDYYYYKRWEAAPGTMMWRRPKIATVFKSYGTLAYPGSLQKNDHNLVLTVGGEVSAELDLPDTDWILTPFAEFDIAWDMDRNGYNNKVVPGLGIKVRYPLDMGELFAGLRFSADYRPIEGTLRTGPGLFLGWYKGF